VAGNTNTQRLREFPCVTEVCVQYVREIKIGGKTFKEWLREEWERTGLPLYKANEAAGVANAASRKWLTKDYLWYPPPYEGFKNWLSMLIYMVIQRISLILL
jgi:site-specific DNA-methyltransferase (adenine-specific)